MGEKDERCKITELFMAKAGSDYTRCFYGTIFTVKTSTGEQAIGSKIKVNSGYIYSQADCRSKLGENLDELVLLVLDHNLHEHKCINSTVAHTDFNHN